MNALALALVVVAGPDAGGAAEDVPDGAQPEPVATIVADARVAMADPSLPTEDKAKALARLQGNLDETTFSGLVASVEPAPAREMLCLRFWEGLERHPVRVEAWDSYGNVLRAAVLVGGVARAVSPVTVFLPQCLDGFVIRDVETGAQWVAQAPALGFFAEGEGRVAHRFPGRETLLVLSGAADFSWVDPGWGDGRQVHGGLGARLDWWGRFLHFSLAARATSFRYRHLYITTSPVIPVADVFAGFGYGAWTSTWQLNFALDVGLWSLLTPTFRASASLAVGRRFVVTSSFDVHVFPTALTPPDDRRTGYMFVPSENFLFWGGQLAFGVRL